jgi:16S rRNA (guanine527-N7)-methyltransferase
MNQIDRYITLLKEYNVTTNIFSKQSYDKLTFHINDCITLSKLITNKKLVLFDFGSGSGLPSIPIAIMNPKNTIYAIESKSRKTNFLNIAKDTLNLTNLNIITQNLFEWKAPCKPNIITAKAFAPLDKINRLYNKFKGKSTFVLIPISKTQASVYEKDNSISIIEVNSFYYAKLFTNNT